MAHITGGGFIDNIPRVLPRACDVVIHKNAWPLSPLFQLLKQKGRVAERELYQVFNMGIGMVLIVAADKADEMLKWIRAKKESAWLIGEVTKGNQKVKIA